MRSLLALALLLSAPASAQDLPEGHPHGDEALPAGHPPTGETLPEGHPPAGAAPAASAPNPHAGVDLEALFRPPNVSDAAPSPEVPTGTLRVEVVDERNVPVPGAAVELGTMSGGRAAARRPSTTDAAGVSTYDGLVHGSGTAYRVYVNHEGARYASTPIVLSADMGHRVRIRRLPVSHDDRQLLQFVAQTIVEIRDDRLHVVVQSQLVNAGDATYVFPEEGLLVRLPEGFLAFDSPPAMNEVEITERAGEGVAFTGSLPPGLITTAYSFDLPYDPGLGFDRAGTEAELALSNPFRTMRYRVITDAPEGLELDAVGFPPPQRFESDGRSLFGSELMRRPGDAPLEEVRFTLRGLPGPGPTRWIAVFGAAVVLGIGFWLGRRRRDEGAARERLRAALEEREQSLLEQASTLRAERDAGEMGPETCQSGLDAIVQELAGVLARLDELGPRPASPGREDSERVGPSQVGPSQVGGSQPEGPPRSRKKDGTTKRSKNPKKDKGPRPEAGDPG